MNDKLDPEPLCIVDAERIILLNDRKLLQTKIKKRKRRLKLFAKQQQQKEAAQEKEPTQEDEPPDTNTPKQTRPFYKDIFI